MAPGLLTTVVPQVGVPAPAALVTAIGRDWPLQPVPCRAAFRSRPGSVAACALLTGVCSCSKSSKPRCRSKTSTSGFSCSGSLLSCSRQVARAPAVLFQAPSVCRTPLGWLVAANRARPGCQRVAPRHRPVRLADALRFCIGHVPAGARQHGADARRAVSGVYRTVRLRSRPSALPSRPPAVAADRVRSGCAHGAAGPPGRQHAAEAAASAHT